MNSFHHVIELVIVLVAMVFSSVAAFPTCVPAVKSVCVVTAVESSTESQSTALLVNPTPASGNICGGGTGTIAFGTFGTITDALQPSNTYSGVADTNTFAEHKGVYTISFSAIDPSGNYWVIDGSGQAGTQPSPSGFSVAVDIGGVVSTPALLSLTIQECPTVASDPTFVGFHGQKYAVKGVAGEVFNLLSSPSFQLNSRFVSLRQQNESVTSWQMERLRHKHHRLVEEMQTGELKSLLPPITSAWGHPGTYMGECGLMVGGSKLMMKPGPYEKGFAALTLDGETVSVSAEPIQLAGGITVVHSTPFILDFVSPDVVFTVVNSGNFVNIERAVLVDSSASQHLSGLLGVSADRQFKAINSAEWISHMEQDFKLASGDIFGTDFATNQYVQ